MIGNVSCRAAARGSHAIYAPEKAADKPPAAFVGAGRQILALEPSNAEALRFVGNDLAQSGDVRPGTARG